MKFKMRTILLNDRRNYIRLDKEEGLKLVRKKEKAPAD